MKNRILPFGLFTLIVGFTFLFSSFKSYPENPGQAKTIVKPVPPGGNSADDHLFQMRCNQNTGTIDPADVSKARNQILRLRTKNTSSLNLNWVPLGPDNLAGRSRAVLYDKNDPTGQTIYTGGVTGGVWKSINSGLTWDQVNTESNEVLRVSSLVQTPNGTIYAATGESACSQTGYPGTGIYRSTDGVSFTVIPATVPVSNTIGDWTYIPKLACDPRNSRLYAATIDALMYSDNGDDWSTAIAGNATDVVVGSDGTVFAAVANSVYISIGGDVTTFVNVSTGTDTTLSLPATVGGIALAVAPSDPNVVYASIVGTEFKLLNIYCSKNKGTTWSVIFPSNTTFDPFSGDGCYSNAIAVFPNNPFKVVLGGESIWMGTKVQETGYYSWQQESIGTYSASLFTSDIIPLFPHTLMFSQNDPNRFAVASDEGISIGSVLGDSISFQTSNKQLVTSQFNSVAFGRSNNYVMGGGTAIGSVSIGAIPLNDPMNGTQLSFPVGTTNISGFNAGNCAWSMINPSAIVYSVTGLTPPMFRSIDLGATVSPTFLGGTAGSNPPYHRGIHSNLIQNLPIYYWESFYYDNSRDSVTFYAQRKDPVTGKIIYFNVPADSTLIIPSSNAAFPFQYTTTAPIEKGDSLRIKDVVQSRFFIYGNKDTVDANKIPFDGIYMTKDLLHFSVDPVWFQISRLAFQAPITTTEPVTCMSVSKDINNLWAGTSRGHLVRLSNIALAHDYATADINSPTCIIATEIFDTNSYPFLKNRYVTSIDIARDNNNVVIVTLGNYGNTNYVFMTENALDSLPTFRLVQGNLPSMPVYSCVMEMSNHNKVILGTDFGIYTTDDISAASPFWSPSGKGMGDVPVTMVKQQTISYYPVQNYGSLYTSTYGRGFFLDTTFYEYLGVPPGPVATSGTNGLFAQPNPFRNMVNVTYIIDQPVETNATVYDIMGKVILTESLGRQQKGEHNITIDLSSRPLGTYIIRINDAYAKVIKVN